MVSAEWLDDHTNSYGVGPYMGAALGGFETRPGEPHGEGWRTTA
jgi:hypothetical protein